MSLDKEWRPRLDHWRLDLQARYYRPLSAVDLPGHLTMKQLSEEEAAKKRFRPMPPGTGWGKKWEYCWFRGTVRLPKEAKGKRIVLVPNVGGVEDRGDVGFCQALSDLPCGNGGLSNLLVHPESRERVQSQDAHGSRRWESDFAGYGRSLVRRAEAD